MTKPPSRRRFLELSAQAAAASVALSIFPPAIRRALAVAAHNRSGTLQDVEHIVIFMQENRSFDHYFGTLSGVRGFADRFPIPLPDIPDFTQRTVWYQQMSSAVEPRVLAPQHNDTTKNFALLRTAGTPHLFPDAQDAWHDGRMANWPQYKHAASMVYFKEADIPFQFALARAFTIGDANHASFMGGTNPNRCFLFTGTNHGKPDPAHPGAYVGPAVDNAYNTLRNGAQPRGYEWMTYAERLEDAGVSWQVYQNNEHQFYALNALFGFRSFRQANAASTPTPTLTRTPRQQALYEKGIRTRDLDMLRADVLADRLPKVSWICATSSGSEHPSASSPAQGAQYTSQVLDALTANPHVWSKTVLILNFDENDGLFDHVPPPAPPSCTRYDANLANATFAGATTVDAADEYLGEDAGGIAAVAHYTHRPFGLGPRVPLYVISPWSKGGWVNSQVFDQTSTIRFIEARFGVHEPNISAWRRAVTGDLISCFNFATPNDTDMITALPQTAARDRASRSLTRTTTPIPSALPELPVQDVGTRPSRALPYELHVTSTMMPGVRQARLLFANTGRAAVVFHVYDRKHLDAIPRRYTVEAGKQSEGIWDVAPDDGVYDLWVLGPNGWHRHFTGTVVQGGANPEVQVCYEPGAGNVYVKVSNTGDAAAVITIRANTYRTDGPWHLEVAPGAEGVQHWALAASGHWYDFSLTCAGQPGYTRRFAGRVETGRDGISDPAMGGVAIGQQWQVS